jgi:gluconate 2-dehydrogenase subunit 3-like protein
MAGQGIERRDALRFIAIASVAATFPGFSRWTFACSHGGHQAPPASAHSQPYKPLFFTSEQFHLVEHLSEMIIPADDTPGAKQAGVAEFIDFMLANRVPINARNELRSTADSIRAGEDAQHRFLSGIDWINARSKSEFGHYFMDCTAEQQQSFLESLAYKAKFKPTTESGCEFFQTLRDYTVVGYYTTKIGLESLGYPGLRTTWPKMPGCSHPDDPEHVHLPQPESKTASLKIADERSV